MENNACLNFALYYENEAKFSVIPVDGISKKPLIEWKEYQTKRATSDEIKAWWEKWPTASVGIVTGAISGITVVDSEAGADLNLFGLTDINTPTVGTGGGGKHFYFAYKQGIKNSVRFAPLYDIRSDGGYVIAPPSDHKSGKKYEWYVPWGLVNPMPFPLKIYNEIIKKDSGAKKDWNKILNENIPTGERNSTAASVCGKLLLKFPRTDWETFAWPLLCAWNAEHSNPPLAEQELQQIFKSIGSAEERRKLTGATVGDPTVAEENGVYTVSVPISDGFAVFSFEDISGTGARMEADVSCSIDIPGVARRPFRQRLKIESGSNRAEYARALNESYGKTYPWVLVLSQCCTALADFMEKATGEEEYLSILPSGTSYLLYPFLEENSPNILFGKGGSGKTYIALRMAISYATGNDFIGELPTKTGNTLFIDYESSGSNFQHRITQLLGSLQAVPDDSLKRFFYYDPKGMPLKDVVKQVKKIILKRSITFVIIDSAALACGGQPEEAGTAIDYFNALAKLKITTLTIAHETKSEEHDKPFGSVFFYNSARNIFNAQNDQEQDENVIHTGLFHRKSNNGKLISPRSCRIWFNNEQNIVDVSRENIQRWGKEVGVKTRILSYLATNIDGARPQKIAEELALDQGQVRARLAELEKAGKAIKKLDNYLAADKIPINQ